MNTASRARSRASLRVRPLRWPPVGDVVVVGSEAPVGPVALQRALALIVSEPYRLLAGDGAAVDGVLVREGVLRWVDETELRAELARGVFPRVAAGELLDLTLEVEVPL